jgi:hypothetical protein
MMMRVRQIAKQQQRLNQSLTTINCQLIINFKERKRHGHNQSTINHQWHARQDHRMINLGR